MKRFLALSFIAVFLGSVLMSGCGHFKPSPGKVKKVTQATQTGGDSNS